MITNYDCKRSKGIIYSFNLPHMNVAYWRSFYYFLLGNLYFWGRNKWRQSSLKCTNIYMPTLRFNSCVLLYVLHNLITKGVCPPLTTKVNLRLSCSLTVRKRINCSKLGNNSIVYIYRSLFLTSCREGDVFCSYFWLHNLLHNSKWMLCLI